MRKFCLRTLMLTLLLCLCFTATAFADDAVVTGSDVNLRSGPGTNYAVLDCLPKGVTVTVVDRSNAQWYSVSYNGRSGFISSAYLRLVETAAAPDGELLVDDGGAAAVVADPAPAAQAPAPSDTQITVQADPAPAPAATPTPTTAPAAQTTAPAASSVPGSINAMYVRFRSGPSTSSAILGTFNRGTALTITGRSGDWTAVVINGVSGYVYSQYVSQGAAAPAATPAPTPTPAPAAQAPAPAEQPAAPSEVTVEAPAEAPAPAAQAPAPAAVPAGATTAYINGDYVRFRSGPSTGDTILGTYNRGKQISVTGTAGTWTAAVIDGMSGYVFSQYVSAADPTAAPAPTIDTTVAVSNDPGYINGNNVRLRTAPSTSAAIIAELNSGTPVIITGTSGDWTAVIINDATGYIYSPYVSRGTIAVTPSQTAPAPASGVGAQAAQLALSFVGYNYKWGGTSPSTGFDCSGLVYYVYKQYGYTLPRVANDQASYGLAVPLEAIQPGDILCFYSGSNYVGHVGIYIGDNKFVHASTSTTGVIISELTGYYQSRGFVIRRVA